MKLQLLRPESQRVAIPGRGAGHPLVPDQNCSAARHAAVVYAANDRAVVHVLSDSQTGAVAHLRNDRRVQHQVECHAALALRHQLGVSILDPRQHQLPGALWVEKPVENIDATKEPSDTELDCGCTTNRLLPGHGTCSFTLGRAQCLEQLQILLL